MDLSNPNRASEAAGRRDPKGRGFAQPGTSQGCGDATVYGPLWTYRGYGSESRLSLRESSAAFAERKATIAACEGLRGDSRKGAKTQRMRGRDEVWNVQSRR
jgi:hypothetical protein